VTRRGDFNTFFHEAARTGVFKSVRDLYGDTRPKLEYGALVDRSTGKHGRSREDRQGDPCVARELRG